MKITEKMLLENLHGITNVGSPISALGDEKIHWNYRVNNSDGIGAHVVGAEARGEANFISLEWDRAGEIDLALNLSPSGREGLEKLTHLQAEIWGDEVAV